MSPQGRLFTAVVCAATAWGTGTPASADGGWSFSAGPMMQFGLQVEASGASHVQQLGMHAGTSYLSVPGSIGSLSSYADRDYDDGFVYMDPGTANPQSIVPGVTWYWGYDSASQVSGGQISFHRQGGVSQSMQTLVDEPADGDADMSALGVFFTATRALREMNGVVLSLDIGLQGLLGLEETIESVPFQEQGSCQSVTVIDRYDLDGINVPNAPYTGTYAGPGPVIPNRPTSRSYAYGAAQTWTATDRVSIDVEASMVNLVLGPRFSMDIGERARVFACPALVGGFIDVSADREETFEMTSAAGATSTLSQWSDSADEQAFLLGAAITLGAELPLSGGWSVGLAAGYQGFFDDVEVDVGPGRVSLRPEGFTVSVMVGKAL